MLERGGFSLVALLVINPVVILFFQNCAVVPQAHSGPSIAAISSQKRLISSVPTSVKSAKSEQGLCDSSRKLCPKATIE